MSDTNNETSISPALLAVLRCPKTGVPLAIDTDQKEQTAQSQSALENTQESNQESNQESDLKSTVLRTVNETDTLPHDKGVTRYPVVGGVPWLLPNPQNSLLDWSGKLHHFAQVLAAEIKQLEHELSRVEGLTHDRLSRVLQGKQHFIRRVGELMMPVIATPQAPLRIYDALRDRAPSAQNLLSYEANLYRDWVWGEEENQASLKILSDLCSEGQSRWRTLVLGAGAARLAVDLHEALNLPFTVATDINPLLMFAAKHILNGKDLDIYEFPLHPRTEQDVAVLHAIKGHKVDQNFHLLFADATKPALAAHAFDCVVTPWLVDIQPLEFSRFMRQLNHYVPIGASWVNFGSLVFNQQRDAFCYAIDEVKQIAAQQGFDILEISQHQMPYLKSPHNAGYRMETVWAWRAVKTQDVAAEASPQVLPGWLLDPQQAIPKAPYLEQFAFTYRIYAQLAAEVDGRTSIEKIGKKLAKQNKMNPEEGIQMVTNFFIDLYTQNSMN
ncbi:hypothetical protein TDB9533_01824 [Thalassocella blandensis]|nr:hypothetical protein TDB9533_01824 [Thalassocella blandensis]